MRKGGEERGREKETVLGTKKLFTVFVNKRMRRKR
jgi:hypothetical protein